MRVTDQMIEAAAKTHVVTLAALDRARGLPVPDGVTLDKFSPELREDSLKAMRASLEAAFALIPN